MDVPRGLTVEAFASLADTLQCRRCSGIGLSTEHVPNNNGILVVCAACGSRSPLGSAVFLRQTATVKRREPLPKGSSIDEVWSTWGGCCIVCGLAVERLRELGVGQQRHHVKPYAEHGHSGTLLPICTSCHEIVNWLQRTARRLLSHRPASNVQSV